MSQAKTKIDITIRNLQEQDLRRADEIVREAFSTHLGILASDFAPGEDLAAHYWVEPEGAFGAFDGQELAGVVFATAWGKFGFFGPLCVSSAHWNKGIAQLLLQQTDKYFKEKGVSSTGLYTFSDSAKHIRLYERFGYYPQRLTANLVKDSFWTLQNNGAENSSKEEKDRLAQIVLDPDASMTNIFPLELPLSREYSSATTLRLFSKMNEDEQKQALKDMDELTNIIFPELSLANEAKNSVPTSNGHKRFIAETLLCYDQSTLRSFAICPLPPTQSSPERRAVYAKFGVSYSYDNAAETLDILFGSLEKYAELIGAKKIRASTNTARTICYRNMLSRGFKVEGYGIAMLRPDSPAYNRADVLILDDWR